jgi:release factor glutamine methyltransferase
MTPTATLRDLVRAARARFVDAGIDADEAAMDAVLLARHVLGWDTARLVAHELDPAPVTFLSAFDRLVARRVGREPISSLIGRRDFWGLEFEVGPDVLAPRPETEIIVEQALAILKQAPATLKQAPATLKQAPATLKQAPATLKQAPATLKGCPTHASPVGRGFSPADRSDGPLVIDVGTGSGCLAICLARECPSARIVATDVSPAALAIAARNAERLDVTGRIEFVRASLVDGVNGPAALVVSNPPYIPAPDIEGLDPEVREWEPRLALDGGPDGLDVIRALLSAVPSVLAPGGWFIMEFGFGQASAVEALVRRSPLALERIVKDLRQIPRTLVARKAERR